MLRKPKEGEDIVADYVNTGLTLNRHPVVLLRHRLNKQRIRKATELYALSNGVYAKAAGLVVGRQRPGTASGVIFLTLEDESGHINNVIVWPKIAARQSKVLLKSKLFAVSGIIQQEEGVLHLIHYTRNQVSGFSLKMCITRLYIISISDEPNLQLTNQ